MLEPDVVAAPVPVTGFNVMTPPSTAGVASELTTTRLVTLISPAVSVSIFATYFELAVVDSQPKPFAAAGIDGWD